MKKMPEKQKSKKKKPKKQNPFFSFFTSFPGGTPYKNPDNTLLRGLDMGADGPPGSPLEITHTHNGILKVLTPPGSVFNPSGRFLLQVLNLFDGSHTFGLRANSSSSPFHEWLLNVGAVETLTIDSLKGLNSGVEIPSGTSTSEKLFALSGQARASATVDLYDNGILVAGPIAVGPLGNWTYNTGPQTPGPHSYTVRGKYDSGPESTPPRTLTVSLPLTVDTSPMILDGVMIRSSHCPYPNGVQPPRNFEERKATGGVEPYTYRSSNTAVAVVSQQAVVVGMNNGRITITIEDQVGAKVSFDVIVSNIYDVTIFHRTDLTYPVYTQQLIQNNWIGITPQIRAALQTCYNPPYFNWTVSPDPRLNRAWTGVTNGASGEVYDIILRLFTWDDQIVNHPLSGLGFWLKK